MTEKRIYEVAYVEGLVAENAALREVAEAAEQHNNAIEQGFISGTRPDIARAVLIKKLDKWREISDE